VSPEAKPARRGLAALSQALRGPAEVSAEQRRLLGVLGLTFLLNQYDMALIGLALPQIQAGLGVAEQHAGLLVGAVRFGAVGSLALALFADRAGRRRLLLLTILGFTACTTLTAFARTPAEFAALQFLARACIGAEEVVAIVVVAEVLAARARGWGFGALAVFGALGHGAAAAAYAFVEVLPFGWRALYALGILPLLLLAWIRRGLRETPRFERERAARAAVGGGGALEPLRQLLSAYPGRLAALVSAVLAFGFTSASALSFVSKTLQEVHGFAPHQVTLFILGGGAAAMAAYPAAGLLSDRFGRRRVICAGLLAHALGAAWFYGASGAAVVPAWIAMMFGFMGCDVLFGALGTELFPTSYRSTASGVRMIALAAGGTLGLVVEGLLFPIAGSHGAAITWMASAAGLALLVIALSIPETALRELEEIAPAPPTPRARTGGTP
jgi:MFS family permease